MQLEYNQLGYFINQLAVSAMYFGMSSQDADSFRTKLNSQVNVRCAPAVVSSPNSPPQLFSLCQNDTCPLAVPVADCGAYQNLTAQGISNSNPTSVASSLLTATKTASSSSGTGEPTSANVASQSKGSDKLSTGGIVGAAIGGAAVLLFAVVALVYLFRRRKTHQGQAHPPGWDQQNYGAQGNYPPSGYPPKDPHMSYVSNAQTASEMDTSRYQSLTGSPIASPDLAAHQHQRAYSSQPPEYPRLSPVEMEGTGNGGGGFAHMSPHQNLPPMDFQGHNEQISHQGQERYTQQWTSQNR